MKVALVHDWLIHMRGGEKVLESLAEIFPEAAIYTLFSNRKRLSNSLQRMEIKNSLLHYLPGIRSYYTYLLPIFPFFIRAFRLDTVDLVISSSHCVAKGVCIPAGAKHICYCHTPMRYLWVFEDLYFGKFPKWVKRLINPLLEWLRKWDVASSRQVDLFVCNSKAVASRIQKIYGREATVIHPPVDAQFFNPNSQIQKKDFYLVVSALTPYKRIDIVIEAFNHWNRQLLIAGDGPMRKEYGKRVETKNIQFLGTVTDEKLVHLYSEAKAVIFPQEEDFGIVPLEAQACGTPVVAYAAGGVLESVKTGVFFNEQTPSAVREAILKLESKQCDSKALRQHAIQFDKAVFKDKIRQTLKYALN